MAGPGGRTVGRANIRVSPNTSRFRGDLLKDLERLERTLTVQIPTRLDTRRLAQDAARIKADMERRLGSVDVDLGLSGARAAEMQLDRVARDRTADVKVDVDRSAIDRAQAAVGRLTGALGGLGKAGGGAVGVAGLAGAFSSLAAGAAAAVVPVVQLGTALAPAAGILATLPALGASVAAGLAPAVIAFQGMGDALGAALSGDADALAESLEDLTPAAQGVVLAVREMAPALSDIRKSVQEDFFAPMVEEVSLLGQRMLPVLHDGLTGVSIALGISAARLVAFAGEAENLRGLELLFESTSRSVYELSDFLPGLLTGFRELGIVGLPFMERGAVAANELAIRFGEWATEAARTGQATAWIEGAISVFKQLGSILGNIGSIFVSIGKAAGNGGLLTTLDQLTGSLADFLQSAEGMEAMRGIFAGLGSVASALSPVFAALLSGIGALAPAVGRIAEAFGPVLTRAIEGLVPALLQLEPGITAVIGALGDGIDALVSSGALELLGQSLSDILIALSPLLPVIGQLAAVLIGALAEALIAIAPGLALLASSLAESLAPVLPELAAAFSELVAAIAPLIPPLVEALLPNIDILVALVELLAENFRTWGDLLVDIGPELTVLIGFLGQFVLVATTVVASVLRMLGAFLAWAGETSAKMREAVSSILARLSNLRDRGTAFIRGLVTGAVNLVVSLRDRAVAIATGLRDRLVGALSNARDRGVAMARGLRDGAVGAMNGLIRTVTGLPGRIQRMFSNARSWLKNAGLKIIYGLIDGINDAVSALWDRISSIARTVREYWPFSPAKRGPLRAKPMDKAGYNVAKMLADGMARGESLVDRAAASLAGGVAADVNVRVPSPADGPAGTSPMDVISSALEALARQPVVVAVDSQEIARATRAGERQLARR